MAASIPKPDRWGGPGWHTPVPADHPATPLLSARAVRARSHAVLDHVAAGRSPHWRWEPSRLAATVAAVVETTRASYPDLRVPVHSRWRHFEAGGADRWAALADAAGLAGEAQRLERARVRIDLVIPSVLLDAGAGAAWHYDDAAHGQRLSRSEGLGVASFDWFARGGWSADLATPLRTDAAALAAVTPDALAGAFQVGADNPLVGLDGRAALLRRLGEVMAATPAVFGVPARLGNMLDFLLMQADGDRIDADVVLGTLLRALGPVWPGRLSLEGVNLGDCWHHPATADGWMPFHKLTQWLTYSLLEPLADAGLHVTGLDALTGLPEYRNGGLLLDTGLLVPASGALPTVLLSVDDPAIVEWRAVTVAALDLIADGVRATLGLSAEAFPLACVLEGGTWATGRRLAAARRPGGAPPLNIASDGTVF
ncbi:DUF1688 family protein [Sphaerotilus montanus]|uniref:DUF1688 family protein n=1 Tax=Sphaerotilus montanus TaxID=522889 RepID=UPI003FA28C16